MARPVGRPRKFKEPYDSFLLKLPRSLKQRLRELTQVQKKTVTQLIQDAITQYIK